MTDEQPPRPRAGERNDEADRGAALGAGTRILTAVIAAALAVVWTIRRLANRCAAAVARIDAVLDARIASVRVVLSRWTRSTLAPLGVAIAFAARQLGRAARAVATRAWRLARTAGWWVRPWLGATIRGLSGVAAVVSCGLRRWGAAGHRVAVTLGRWVQRGAVPLARAARCLLEPPLRAAGAVLVRGVSGLFAVLAHAVRLALAVLAPAVRAVAAVLAPAVRAVVAALARVGAPLRRASRFLRARLGGLGGPIGQWMRRLLHRAGQRAVHSVRVAGTKALAGRLEAVPAPASAAATARSTPAPAPNVRLHLATSHNPYLAAGATAVDAIVTVTAAAEPGQGAPERAEVILLDCSGSMAYPITKLDAARAATATAIDAMDDGTWFAVVRGTHRAEQIYPRAGLAEASPVTRAEARSALRLLWPEGGTAMGRWLSAARDLIATRPAAIGHVILLTDGCNESESSADLEAALRACRGAFQCDCRGVGTDWSVDELRRVACATLGTLDIVAEPAGLVADFRSMTRASMARQTAGVAVRVWTPKGATVQSFQQVSPAIADLGDIRMPVDELTADYPTGAWGAEARSYHLRLAVPGGRAGAELLAARITLQVGGEPCARALITATWSEDPELTARVDPEVAHYSGQAELAEAIQDGLEARRAGDEATATVKLGRAVQLAAASENEPTLKLLEAVVDVEDARAGTVRLRVGVEDRDEMALDTRSVKSVAAPSACRSADQGPSAPVPARPVAAARTAG